MSSRCPTSIKPQPPFCVLQSGQLWIRKTEQVFWTTRRQFRGGLKIFRTLRSVFTASTQERSSTLLGWSHLCTRLGGRAKCSYRRSVTGHSLLQFVGRCPVNNRTSWFRRNSTIHGFACCLLFACCCAPVMASFSVQISCKLHISRAKWTIRHTETRTLLTLSPKPKFNKANKPTPTCMWLDYPSG